MRVNYRDEESPVTILTREQDRRLRAQAWRHVRRIIGAAQAHALYKRVRARQAGVDGAVSF